MRQARARTFAPPSADLDVKLEPKEEFKDEAMDVVEGAGSVPLPTANDVLPPVTATLVGVAGTPLRPHANGAAARAAPAADAKPKDKTQELKDWTVIDPVEELQGTLKNLKVKDR